MKNAIKTCALLSFVFLSACASSNRFASEPPPHAPVGMPQDRMEAREAENQKEVGIEARLRREVAKWDGTPHVYGGETMDGVDCSAFVQQVFANALDLHLPRTTSDQVHTGRAVDRSDLRAGDLVFFRPRAKNRHVGIYLRDGEFAHASTSRGVMISHIGQDYWEQAFWTTRRVLPEMIPPSVVDRTEERFARIDERLDRVDEQPVAVEKVAPVEAVVEQPRRARIGW